MDDRIRMQRSAFPRGLSQSKTGHRFSVDSLLLASFARIRRKDRRGLDLGTGCGVVGLALLLLHPDQNLRITGLDIDPEMARHASINAERLGLQQHFNILNEDVSSYRTSNEPPHDFVSCNPPWRDPASGRLSPGPDKARARAELDAGLDAFASAASRALGARGRFFLLHTPDRLEAVLASCRAHGLAPKRLRLVHGHAEAPARALLLEAVRNGAPGLAVEPPLLLYRGPEPNAPHTGAALAFCPFLGCNRAAMKE